MISKKDVQHIAKLARLGLTSKEIEKFRKELSSILDYIEKLKEVDVFNTESTSHSVLVENVMRDDENLKLEPETKKLIDLSPARKDNYLKIKAIFLKREIKKFYEVRKS